MGNMMVTCPLRTLRCDTLYSVDENYCSSVCGVIHVRESNVCRRLSRERKQVIIDLIVDRSMFQDRIREIEGKLAEEARRLDIG